jgi:hypothetical protein
MKENFMKIFVTESKSTQKYPIQQKHEVETPKQEPVSIPTHDDIARRAYAIYLKHGRRQGQSEQNWHQAEHELRNEKLEAHMQG